MNVNTRLNILVSASFLSMLVWLAGCVVKNLWVSEAAAAGVILPLVLILRIPRRDL